MHALQITILWVLMYVNSFGGRSSYWLIEPINRPVPLCFVVCNEIQCYLILGYCQAVHMDFPWASVLQAILAVVTCAATSKDPCTSRKDCSTCIQEPLCNWCSDPTLDSTTRCSRKQQACGANFLFDPINNSTNLVDEPLVSYENSSSQVVQIAPQKIQLKARINVPINITLRYARAENRVDLYYLMDLSYSMRDDKDTLSSLGKNLQVFMKKYTSDLQLGFGSFVDKIVGPYTNTVPSMLAAPCPNCTSPYGFQNHLKLSEDAEHFTAEVAKAHVSGNVDDLEGGFDALMQAIVCKDLIGWRNNTRRLLIFSTDSGFHMAGDGKLGGITLPNDGECHMNAAGQYTHSLLQDYPSVSHINYKVQENAINVIFAVTESQVKAYRNLAKSVEGAQAGKLTANSSNILELVEEQYKIISSSVEMTYIAPDFVNITFFTSCQNSTVTQSNKCDGLVLGQEVEFQVQVTVTSCPPDPRNWTTEFKIYPVGSSETSLVHLELQCDCPCEHKDDPNFKPEAPECSYNGTYMCGICKCDDSHTGQKCECDSHQLISSDIGTSNCRAPGDECDCSNRGTCFCGICQCSQRDNKEEVVSGQYCECDNFSCLQNGGLLCAGHGTCDCGICKCNAGWTQDDCSCSSSLENCIENGQICSQNGDCICGRCSCHQEYEGKFCQQESSEGLKSACKQLLPCVLCKVHKTGPLTEQDCEGNCTEQNIEIVDELIEISQNMENCIELDSRRCRCEYQYFYNGTSILAVKALSKLDCPPVLGVASIIGSILGLILVIGIVALALWKLLVTRKDRREFARFEKEKERANFNAGGNPLYRQPTTTFKNPMYGGLS